MSSPPLDGHAEVLVAIESAKLEILDVLRREVAGVRDVVVSDEDLREVIDRLGEQIKLLISQAESYARVDLRLDDLFDVVVRLTKTAKSIDAVDLEVNRWENDERARRYFAQNLAALQGGTRIRRIYVISPLVTEADLNTVQETISRHLECNDNDDVSAAKGQLDIGVVYHEDLLGHDYRDFAVFDDNKVLIEQFGPDWVSTFKGRLTKDSGEVTDCRHQFRTLWRIATRLKSQTDVSVWASEIRDRIANRSFTHDVFIGYCRQARPLALEIVNYIQQQQYTVKDWEQFPTGGDLLAEIEKAARNCRVGLFLFTKDDERTDAGPTPRDNVVLEYGFFLARKSPGHVFLVLENGATPPSDIAGIIREPLADRGDPSTIHRKLQAWLVDTLGRR